MRVHSEAATRSDAVVVNDAERAKAHVLRIVILSEREAEITVEPAMVGMASFICSTYVHIHHGTMLARGLDSGKYHVSCLTITIGYARKSVRASIHNVTRVIKSNGPPKQITQKPFDFDSSHYRRLCNLGETEPEGVDLLDYALDMQYMELQPELLRYLTPILLSAWKKDLFEGGQARYGGFAEHFWPALLKGNTLHKVFSEAERDVFIAYIRNSILDRWDAEESLCFSGMGASPYLWTQALASYGTLFSDVEVLWTEWWQMKTPGHATAAFQYTSVLMYEENGNPIFAPWTKDQGGGPPTLWECGAMMFDVGWKAENTAFLKRTLGVDYFEKKLQLALGQIKNQTDNPFKRPKPTRFAGI